jgi:hypothetical protein
MKKPRSSIRAKIIGGALLVVGIGFLLFVLPGMLLSRPEKWPGGARRDIGYSQAILYKYPPLPKNTTELRSKLLHIRSNNLPLSHNIPSIFYEKSIYTYIRDLADFTSTDNLNIFAEKKIKVKNCEKPTILYFYQPDKNIGYFFTCEDNYLDTNYMVPCCDVGCTKKSAETGYINCTR